MSKQRKILMTKFLKSGYNPRSDGDGLRYEDLDATLRITFTKDYVYYVNGSKHLQEFIPESDKDIFNKIEEIKEITGEQLVKVDIREEVFD